MSIQYRAPNPEVRTQPPASVVPSPRSSPEGQSWSSSPQVADASVVDPGPSPTAGFSPSLIAVLVVVCLVLMAVLGYLGFTVWEISQSSPLSGLFPTS